MNRKFCMYSVLSAAVLVSAGALQAQETLQGPPPMVVFQGMGPEGGANVMFSEKIELLGFEGLPGGRVVTGAPFSATISTETTQTLQDGTAIHRTSQGAIYRDSQGRTRREMTMTGFGPLAASGEPHTMVSISDPVAGTHFMLDTTNKVANKMSVHQAGGGPEMRTQGFEQKMQTRIQQEEASGALKTESLGTQTINGVNAQGTRITHTIPVGQIGNDRPIAIVSERWYSPDLQIMVKTTRTDPQFGTTTYTVTNIQRTEPAATLFTVPSDYTVQAGPKGLHIQHRTAGAVELPPPPPDDQD